MKIHILRVRKLVGDVLHHAPDGVGVQRELATIRLRADVGLREAKRPFQLHRRGAAFFR